MKNPLYREISYQNPEQIFAQFAQQKGAVFLDSAQLMAGCGRYSFIAVDPFYILEGRNGEAPWQHLSTQLSLFPLECHSDLPPFQGGVIGFFGYDLYQYLEQISGVQMDDMAFPDVMLGFYDLVLAFDHELKRAWIFSSGYPLQEKAAREVRAKERCDWLLKQLHNDTMVPSDMSYSSESLTSNFTREQYCEAVQKVKDYILAGDIFEANISQRFRVAMPDCFEPFYLYQRLRKTNPAPFSGYLNFGDTILASASPERFLKLTQRHVETRPIKGTRRRGKTLDEDKQLADELMQSEKDHAENVMIVDLLRNDLSRVCEDHSVQVPQLCGLESYANVHHLVSVVRGRLRKNVTAVDLLCATFPGGSITGAPKVRAMEIIAEIEPTRRGPYCGSIGYVGFNGDMDTSITIRTYAIKKNIVTFQAGGAIVADSDPVAEYEETLIKANSLIKALTEIPA